MKKFLLILLALAMCTGLCACSTYSASPGKVTNNDGETEEMTPRDLCEINDDDEDEFESLYEGAKVEIDFGEVIKVESRTQFFAENPALTDTWYDITVLGGWVIKVTKTAHPEASSIEVGDLITVETTISSCTEEFVYLGNSHYIDHWEDDTYITIHYVND